MLCWDTCAYIVQRSSSITIPQLALGIDVANLAKEKLMKAIAVNQGLFSPEVKGVRHQSISLEHTLL